MGGGSIGGMHTPVMGEAAIAIVQRALQMGLRYVDTSPYYGYGESERLFGRALDGVPRDDFVISTKVGRVAKPVESAGDTRVYGTSPRPHDVFDFSRDSVLRSLEESLRRLGLDRVDIALIHDPENHYEQALEGAYPALVDLRSKGVVRAIGVGTNYLEPLTRFARDGDPDCFLLAGRYTLLDQSGLIELLPLCEQKGIGVIVGGPYNSGVLASDLSPGAAFFYEDAPPDVLERARRVKAVCDRHGVPIKAAALQFGLAHPAVVTTIPGPRSVAELEENFSLVQHPVPSDLWAELRDEGLIRDDAPAPS